MWATFKHQRDFETFKINSQVQLESHVILIL